MRAEQDLLLLLRREPLHTELSYDDNVRAILDDLRARLRASRSVDTTSGPVPFCECGHPASAHDLGSWDGKYPTGCREGVDMVEDQPIICTCKKYRPAPPGAAPEDDRHVCGLQGYNPMIDPPCPACSKPPSSPTARTAPTRQYFKMPVRIEVEEDKGLSDDAPYFVYRLVEADGVEIEQFVERDLAIRLRDAINRPASQGGEHG